LRLAACDEESPPASRRCLCAASVTQPTVMDYLTAGGNRLPLSSPRARTCGGYRSAAARRSCWRAQAAVHPAAHGCSAWPSPTCADLTTGYRQINALAGKSPLRFFGS
jgi:hypothetical protein